MILKSIGYISPNFFYMVKFFPFFPSFQSYHYEYNSYLNAVELVVGNKKMYTEISLSKQFCLLNDRLLCCIYYNELIYSNLEM